MNTKLLDVVCIAVLCIILSLGLWPFHTPPNDVTWLGERNGLRLGRYGTAISSGAFRMPSPLGDELAGTVEIWLQPARMWDGGAFLSFSMPEDLLRLSLHQSLTDLLVRATILDSQNRRRPVGFYVDDVFRRKGPAFIAVTAGTKGFAVYIDGVLARRAPPVRLPANPFTGRIVLGGAPGQEDSWTGRLLGFAIYGREVSEARLLRHYQTWTQTGRPEPSEDDGNTALYLFDERSGSVIHSRVKSGVDLSIPEKYAVLDQIFLEPFWKEFSMSESYWSAVLKNVVGFIPLGFCFCARLSLARGVKRVALTTVLLGTLVSITIEVLQSQLPTRDSGMTDIFTNTLGTWVGVALFRSGPAQSIFTKLMLRLSGGNPSGAASV
jgi:VanZ like family